MFMAFRCTFDIMKFQRLFTEVKHGLTVTQRQSEFLFNIQHNPIIRPHDFSSL